MRKKLNAKLRACSFEAIGLYVYMVDHCTNNATYVITTVDPIATFFNSLKHSPGIDRALCELDSQGLIVYDRYQITINELAPRDVRNYELDDALTGVWLQWVNYKADEKKSGYKSAESETRAYNQLLREANSDETLAANVLLNAMAMGWHGPNTDVYLKRQNNLEKNKPNDTSNQKLGRIDAGELTDWLNS